MQQTEPTQALNNAKPATNRTERKRVEQVMQTLATIHSEGESLAEVAHEARNMVTALGLYCDLLEGPGVLATPYAHYGHELRLVAAASRRLVEKLVALDAHAGSSPATEPYAWRNTGRWPLITAAARNSMQSGVPGMDPKGEPQANHRWDLLPAVPVANLAAELLASRNLLSALVGPAIALTMEADGGARPVRLTGEELTRILVNLVKNASEAMSRGGRIHISLRERPAAAGTAACLALAVEDNGPGIPESALEKVFTLGYTTRGNSESEGAWALAHRGLGLAITRSIVETAGGRIVAVSRNEGGARFEIELPVRESRL